MPATTDPTISTSLTPIPADRFGPREARHLLNRVGFGGTPDEVAATAELGPADAVAGLLDFPSDPDDQDMPTRAGVIRDLNEAERRAARRARAARDENVLAELRRRREEMQRADRAQLAELQAWWIGRMIDSPTPARERLALFWHGHFATSYRGQQNAHHLGLQSRMFRTHALGPFDRLACGIIRDPAMLAYLNNNTSNRRTPNENLARELMELFTLGEGNYTERDIKEGARALTGYTFENDAFVFREDWHDGDTKTILGVRGQLDGDGFVTAILRRRDCAAFIAHRLYRFYVADIPDAPSDAPPWAAAVIGRLASQIRRDEYNLRPALESLFLSEHFYDPAIIGARIKSPVELLVIAARSLGARGLEPRVMFRLAGQMGQALFLPPSVAGWAGGRAWINTSTLIQRQNALVVMLAGQARAARGQARGATGADPRTMFAAGGQTPASFARALVTHALNPVDPAADPAASRIAEIERFIDESGGGISREAALGAVALVAAMPEYQLC